MYRYFFRRHVCLPNLKQALSRKLPLNAHKTVSATLSPDVELHTYRITPYHVSPEGQESKCQVDVSNRKAKGSAKIILENMDKTMKNLQHIGSIIKYIYGPKYTKYEHKPKRKQSLLTSLFADVI